MLRIITMFTFFGFILHSAGAFAQPPLIFQKATLTGVDTVVVYESVGAGQNTNSYDNMVCYFTPEIVNIANLIQMNIRYQDGDQTIDDSVVAVSGIRKIVNLKSVNKVTLICKKGSLSSPAACGATENVMTYLVCNAGQ